MFCLTVLTPVYVDTRYTTYNVDCVDVKLKELDKIVREGEEDYCQHQVLVLQGFLKLSN